MYTTPLFGRIKKAFISHTHRHEQRIKETERCTEATTSLAYVHYSFHYNHHNLHHQHDQWHSSSRSKCKRDVIRSPSVSFHVQLLRFQNMIITLTTCEEISSNISYLYKCTAREFWARKQGVSCNNLHPHHLHINLIWVLFTLTTRHTTSLSQSIVTHARSLPSVLSAIASLTSSIFLSGASVFHSASANVPISALHLVLWLPWVLATKCVASWLFWVSIFYQFCV